MPAVDMFVVVEDEANGQHRFTLLEPNGADWLDRMAAIYRDLRTETIIPIEGVLFEGLEFDVGAIQRRLIETQVPARATARLPLAVERSDFAEVALALAGDQLRQYVYGYRSTRDRELVALPGRGIDQIGVARATVGERTVVYLSLGEAKLSSQARTPPGVVQYGDDTLHAQHLGHLSERDATSGKIYSAARRATDSETQSLLFLAAHLWDGQASDSLVVRCTSMLVRPSTGVRDDAGDFRTTPEDFMPGEVDFMLLRLPNADVEEVIDQFQALAARTDTDEA